MTSVTLVATGSAQAGRSPAAAGRMKTFLLSGLLATGWLSRRAGGLVGSSAGLDVGGGCEYDWVVLAGLVPFYELDGGVDESVEDTVSRSVSLDGNQLYHPDAMMRLTWVLAKRVGDTGSLYVDWRATSQAAGIGVTPRIAMAYSFWDEEAGSRDASISDIWPNSKLTKAQGWSLIVNITETQTFAPVRIITQSEWRDPMNRLSICNSEIVFRTPLLELGGLTSKEPYVVIGQTLSLTLPLAQDSPESPLPPEFGQAGPSLGRNGEGSETQEQHQVDIEMVPDPWGWRPFAYRNVWSAIGVEQVPGVSWVRFAFALPSDLAGGSKAVTLWASTNDFLNIGRASITALDLGFIYPFQTPRSHVGFEWDLDPFDEVVYDYVGDTNDDLEGAVKAEESWYTGPCASIPEWRPQIFSYGSLLLASTSWGIAVKDASETSLNSMLINYGWTAIAPICGRVVPFQQVDTPAPGKTCMFFVIPLYDNVTVGFDSEPLYDAGIYQNVSKLTLFQGASDHCGNVPARPRTKTQDAANNAADVAMDGIYEEDEYTTSSPTAAPTERKETSYDAPADTTVANFGVSMLELRDSDGQTLGQAFESSIATAIVGAIHLVPQAKDFSLVLVSTQVESHFAYSVVSFNPSGGWRLEFKFPPQGLPPRPLGPWASGERVTNALGQNNASVPLELVDIVTGPKLSTQVYLYGNALLLSVNAGRSFWRVAQSLPARYSVFEAAHEVDESNEALLFHKDPITGVTLSSDGWIAVLTQDCNVWAGRAGAGTIFLAGSQICNTQTLVSPISIFFTEANDLKAIGMKSLGAQGEFRTLADSVAIDLGHLKELFIGAHSLRSIGSEQAGDVAIAYSHDCPLQSLTLFAQHRTDQIRQLYSREGFPRDELVDVQNQGYFNELPTRIFLDYKGSYSFLLRLYGTEAVKKQPALIDLVKIGFDLSNQSAISFTAHRHVDYLLGIVEYNVTLSDRGLWEGTATSNQELEEESGNVQIIDSLEEQVHALNINYGLSGDGMAVHKFRMQGLTKGCFSALDPAGLVSVDSVQPPQVLSIYSGCPPLKKIVFDRQLSMGGMNHGCSEESEDICLFYNHKFEPKFKLIDDVTGSESVVGGDFGEIVVVGGGPTFRTIEEYPLESRYHVTSQVLTLSLGGSLLRWVCGLVPDSPCYRVEATFPQAPQYYFRLEFRSNSNSSYCDFATTFTVRVHNLPITIETILITNGVTMLCILIPLLLVYRRRQRKLKTTIRVQDVDMSEYSKEHENLSDYESDDSSSSSDDATSQGSSL